MSLPRFLADHDFNDHIGDGVLRLEPTLVFAKLRDVGLQAATDAAVLEYAATQGLIVVSHDSNSMTAAAVARIQTGRLMTGLFLTPQTALLGPCIDHLVLVWAASQAEEWHNRIAYFP